MHGLLFGKIGVIPISNALVILVYLVLVVMATIIWVKNNCLLLKIFRGVVIIVMILMAISSVISFLHEPLSNEDIVIGISFGVGSLAAIAILIKPN